MSAQRGRELAPCPFCGASGEALRVHGRDTVCVQCLSCLAQGPVFFSQKVFREMRGRSPKDDAEKRIARKDAATRAVDAWERQAGL